MERNWRKKDVFKQKVFKSIPVTDSLRQVLGRAFFARRGKVALHTVFAKRNAVAQKRRCLKKTC